MRMNIILVNEIELHFLLFHELPLGRDNHSGNCTRITCKGLQYIFLISLKTECTIAKIRPRKSKVLIETFLAHMS